MAQIRCVSCDNWTQFVERMKFCIACGKPLDADDYQELIALDQKALHEFTAVEAPFLPIAGASMGFGLMFEMFFHPLIPAYPGILVIPGFFLGWLFFAGILKNWQKKRLVKRYERIWSLPNTFRPSVPKPE